MNNWKPINTAPKDRRILLYYPEPTNAPNIIIGYAGEHNGHKKITATHWMELPKPPEQ
jgi:hypothetical protein